MIFTVDIYANLPSISSFTASKSKRATYESIIEGSLIYNKQKSCSKISKSIFVFIRINKQGRG